MGVLFRKDFTDLTIISTVLLRSKFKDTSVAPRAAVPAETHIDTLKVKSKNFH